MRLIFLFILALTVPAYPADWTNYGNTIVSTTLVKNDDGTLLRLNLPFTVYGQNIVAADKDITYGLDDLKLENTAVIAKVDYALSDQSIVDSYAGDVGYKWADVKKDARYAAQYDITKEEALATYTIEGVKVPYSGVDKAEIVKFCQWEEK